MNLELLKEPLPSEAVKKHPTKTYLSSIKAIYVTERFNEAFGVGKWTTKVKHVTNGDGGMVVVHVTFEVPEIGIYYECFGGNDNGGESSKNFDLGDAYKGATTDALTKIGSYLGVGIDVFKGVNDSKTPLKVGDQNWPKVIQALKGGYKIEQIKLKYSFDDKTEVELKTQAEI